MQWFFFANSWTRSHQGRNNEIRRRGLPRHRQASNQLSFRRPINITLPTVEFSSAQRRAYPATVPVAPTSTRRFWFAAGSFMHGPEELRKRWQKTSGEALSSQRALVNQVDIHARKIAKRRRASQTGPRSG